MNCIRSLSRALILGLIAGLCINGNLSQNPIITNMEVKTGEYVLLRCIFDTTVQCVWMKNDKRIDIDKSSRYALISPNNPSRNCSLKMKKFATNDIGNWTCSSASDDRIDGIVLQTYLISSKLACIKNTTIKYTGKRSQRATISCQFNKPVKCNWKRGNTLIKVGKRYKQMRNTKDSTVCMMQIKNIHPIDVGIWSCSSMASDKFNSVHGGNVTLTMSRKKSRV